MFHSSIARRFFGVGIAAAVVLSPFVGAMPRASAQTLPASASPPMRPGNPVRTSGKYAVELRLPAEGIYAGEETDVEFRVSDTAKPDPIRGATGVIRAKVTATV